MKFHLDCKTIAKLHDNLKIAKLLQKKKHRKIYLKWNIIRHNERRKRGIILERSG